MAAKYPIKQPITKMMILCAKKRAQSLLLAGESGMVRAKSGARNQRYVFTRRSAG
jgi:hypothetical protein